MNTSLVNIVCEQVVKYICEKVADDLIETLNKALEDGKENDEVCDAIRERLQQVYNDIPKSTTTTTNMSVARPAASSSASTSIPKGPGSRGSSSSSSHSTTDKLKDAQGNFIKCQGITKKDNSPCKNDAKNTIMENGVAKYYCGIHSRVGSGTQPNPNAKPGGTGRGAKPAAAQSNFISVVQGNTDFGDTDLDLNDGDVVDIN